MNETKLFVYEVISYGCGTGCSDGFFSTREIAEEKKRIQEERFSDQWTFEIIQHEVDKYREYE